MPRSSSLHTRITIEAHELAEVVNSGFEGIRLGVPEYVPELTSPEGPSTAGGIQALQRVKLVARKPGFANLVVGSANRVTGVAELRNYDYVDAVHRARFKRPVELGRAEYDEFLEIAVNLLQVAQLRPQIIGPPASGISPDWTIPPPADEPLERTSAPILLGMLAFALVVMIAGILVALTKKH
ncbi:MAG: hypothetical protein U0169_18730 [Polyangiaceae bacterium]